MYIYKVGFLSCWSILFFPFFLTFNLCLCCCCCCCCARSFLCRPSLSLAAVSRSRSFALLLSFIHSHLLALTSVTPYFAFASSLVESAGPSVSLLIALLFQPNPLAASYNPSGTLPLPSTSTSTSITLAFILCSARLGPDDYCYKHHPSPWSSSARTLCWSPVCWPAPP